MIQEFYNFCDTGDPELLKRMMATRGAALWILEVAMPSLTGTKFDTAENGCRIIGMGRRRGIDAPVLIRGAVVYLMSGARRFPPHWSVEEPPREKPVLGEF
jgi:hypothetical protein